MTTYDGAPFRYRPGTSDERVFAEVCLKRCYRRFTMGFDVEPGERWLDLGANVGAFAVYCKARGAVAECYEPEPSCFTILERNAAEFRCIRAAVTIRRDSSVRLWSKRNTFARATVSPSLALVEDGPLDVPNVYAGGLVGPWDGVKMDIEGSEMGIIDAGVLPRCRKLVLEYHSSRDPSAAALGRRLTYLKERFGRVEYPAELDRIVAGGVDRKTFCDRSIWCMNENAPA